jgi:hypothetical protein
LWKTEKKRGDLCKRVRVLAYEESYISRHKEPRNKITKGRRERRKRRGEKRPTSKQTGGEKCLPATQIRAMM